MRDLLPDSRHGSILEPRHSQTQLYSPILILYDARTASGNITIRRCIPYSADPVISRDAFSLKGYELFSGTQDTDSPPPNYYHVRAAR